MQTLKGILVETSSKPIQLIYTRGFMLIQLFINSKHSFSTTTLIALPCFSLLNCKITLQFQFLNDILRYIYSPKF